MAAPSSTVMTLAAPAIAVPTPLAGHPARIRHTPAEPAPSPEASQPAQHPPPAADPPPPTTPATIWDTAHDRLTLALALKQMLATTCPSYAKSFGAVKYERPTSSGARLVVWTVAVNSSVDAIWTTCLVPSLMSLIEANKAKLEAQRPPKSPGNPSYALQCYILGHDETRATPYVCVISLAAWFRKAICGLVVKSMQLKPPGFRCVGLHGDPGFLTSPNMALSSHEMSIAPLRDFQVRITSQHGGANGLGIEILHDEAVISRATIGGVVKIGNHLFGMTVRHAFKMPEPPEGDPQEAPEDDDHTVSTDFEEDIFDSDSEEADDDDNAHSVFGQQLGGEAQIHEQQPTRAHEMSLVRRHDYGRAGDDPEVDASLSQPMYGAALTSHRVQSSPESAARAEAFGQLIIQEALDDTALAMPDSRLDWALKRVTGELCNQHFSKPFNYFSSERIQIKTSSQLIQGSLESSGIFGIHNVLQPQPVLIASTPDVIAQPGDSGSWAMRLKNGAFDGMLLGACPSMSSVYILRMSDILDDIRQQTGLEPTVSAPPVWHRRPRREGWAPPRGGGALALVDQTGTPGGGAFFEGNYYSIPAVSGEAISDTSSGLDDSSTNWKHKLEASTPPDEIGGAMETLVERRRRIQRVLDTFEADP
ncbi:hypothetical protein B0J18DRAFT_78089 [Chaetomium sp. MPI-SDFR-AT-0129]|nr:hypothetical protein B0J18DRAFT_78089 [Chaetomium sp. MPI-SDFR-AT-0129]